MTTRREILLDALDGWRREDALDEATYRALRARYDPAGVADPRLDAPLAEVQVAAARDGARREGSPSLAAAVTQFVGGLLLGAAIVALMPFLELGHDATQWSLFALGLVPIAIAAYLQLNAAEERASLVQAAFAAGLVPLIVSAGFAVGDNDRIGGAAVTTIAVAIHVFRRGNGPAIGLAAVAAVLGTFALSGPPEIFDIARGTLQPIFWLLLLLGYFGLVLAWRHEAWSSVAAGLLVIPLTFAYIGTMQSLFGDQSSVTGEILVGLLLGAFLALGIRLDVRGVTAVAAAGLTIDAVVFAFDVGGALTAVLVLLALGGLLVWQGGPLLRYFRRKPT